jgi:small redox-active disulfide protein 2
MFVVLRITKYSFNHQKYMEIKVLGTGCSSCKALYATVEKVVKELGINASLVKEEDMEKILQYQVMSLPALVIDEKVVAKGKISEKEVKEILTNN